MAKSKIVEDYEEFTKNSLLDEIPDDDEEVSEEDERLARIIGPDKANLMRKKTMFSVAFDCDEDCEEDS